MNDLSVALQLFKANIGYNPNKMDENPEEAFNILKAWRTGYESTEEV